MEKKKEKRKEKVKEEEGEKKEEAEKREEKEEKLEEGKEKSTKKPKEKKRKAPKEEKPEEAPKEKPKKIKEKKTGKKSTELTGILHIYSSKNNTILHVTDITGAETFSIKTGGQMVKSQREESSPYAAMQATKGIIKEIQDKGVTKLHVKVRAPGGYNGPHWTGKGAQAALKTIFRSSIKIESVENVTPIPHGYGCRPKGGRRGRRV